MDDYVDITERRLLFYALCGNTCFYWRRLRYTQLARSNSRTLIKK